ncbi:hypothetical protein AAE02nite_05770 [Adhaeribacter aerolatus]|uniref:DNA-directed RNA polymerase sigma-70 factor n=1 Tax=Adhaeribacter aerolatus TaxID=670289 RepID=A0A512AT94_9BACT|nr:sigma-70 family RNA polymerase sigma factor [Adhaeribacter aerolatus]GEO02913.1 hypothetical protein AAE02nite_05770 [Adhaeribacter aerolatus]
MTEEKILHELKNRNENTIRSVYQANWPMILQMVKVNNGNEAEAKDLYQDSMLDFLEKVWEEDFVLTCKIKTFIYSICRRKWLYRLRGKVKFIDIETYTEVTEIAIEIPEEATDLPDDNQIMNAINQLGEPCKSLLIGFYYEKLTMEQLAQKLNYKSLNVAKQQKFRCKDRLKNAILNRP